MYIHEGLRYQRAGGGMFIHHGLRYQRGGGFGSIFSMLFRTLKPLASMGLRAGKNFIQSNAVKSVGNTLLDIGKDAAKKVAVDLLEGKPLKETVNHEIDDAKKKLQQNLREKAGNGGEKEQ